MAEKNIYKPIKYKVDKIVTETPLIKTFFISADQEFEFQTGQFVEVTLDGIGEAPYTPSSSPSIKDKMELTIMNAGYVTGKMHELKGGETIGIRGPYGKGYPIEKFYGKEILILGGGVGQRLAFPWCVRVVSTRYGMVQGPRGWTVIRGSEACNLCDIL